jgi:hypothetical protein
MGVLASFLNSQSADENSQRIRSDSQGFSSDSQNSRNSQALLTENEASIKLTVKDKVYLIEFPTVDGVLSLPSPAENENPVTPVANSANSANSTTLAAAPARSGPSDDARASVDKLLADMALDLDRRKDWWRQPVDSWRDGRLEIRSVLTGELTTIRLSKRRNWQ